MDAGTGAASPVVDPPKPGEQLADRRALWPEAMAAVAALAVFMAGSWIRPYWLDEATTAMVERRSLLQILKLLPGDDPALVPYYLLMWPWHLVSESPIWMRLASVLAMATAAVVMFAWVRRAVGFPPALAVVFVFLALPAVNRYAQEVRPYAFVVLLSVIASLLWFRAANGWVRGTTPDGQLATESASASSSQGSRAFVSASLGWTLYGLSLILLGLVNSLALTLVIAHTAAALVDRYPRRIVLSTIVSGLIATIVLSPFLVLVGRRSGGTGVAGLPSPATILRIIDGALGPNWLLLTLLVLMVAALLPDAVAVRRRLAHLALAWIVVPSAILLAMLAMGDTHLGRPRYYLLITPGVALLAGIGLARLVAWSRLWSLIIPVVIVLSIPAQLQVRSRAIVDYRDSTNLVAVVDAPALAGLPVSATTTAYALLASANPDAIGQRMFILDDPAPVGHLGGKLLDPDRLRSVTAPYSALLLADDPGADTNEDSRVRGDRHTLATLGFTSEYLVCRGRQAYVVVLARAGAPSTGMRLASTDVIAAQVATRSNSAVKCERPG